MPKRLTTVYLDDSILKSIEGMKRDLKPRPGRSKVSTADVLTYCVTFALEHMPRRTPPIEE